MDSLTDRAARFGLDNFWLLRSRVVPQAETAALQGEPEEDVSVLGRDWNDVSVRLGAVRWYAR